MPPTFTSMPRLQPRPLLQAGGLPQFIRCRISKRANLSAVRAQSVEETLLQEDEGLEHHEIIETPNEAPETVALNTGPPPFSSTHMTKIICTIGPNTCSLESLQQLAANGMNVARLNMTHGDHDWHSAVIRNVRQLNNSGFNVAIMMDTEGSEVHLLAKDPVDIHAGEAYTFSVRPAPPGEEGKWFSVSYEAFVDDIEIGDNIMVDGGMAILRVSDIQGPEVTAVVVEPGVILSRANLTFRRGTQIVRGRNAMLPVITSKDWKDIDFAIQEEVDFIAVSFVKSPDVIMNLKSYIQAKLEKLGSSHTMEVVAKLESYDSVPNMSAIISASDGVMVARGDLGAQIPFEDVPAVQKEIVFRCRQAGRPVIVASQLLNSMMSAPVPTRAEVADCADVVRQQADALMLSGETAAGKYPLKCMQVLQNVCENVETWGQKEKFGAMKLPILATTLDGRTSEELCAAASILANNLGARAIVVYTRRGYMANYLSRRRPDCPILAVTDSPAIRRRMAMRWGVTPYVMDLSQNPESNIVDSFELWKSQNILKKGDLVVVVSDIRPADDVIRSIQVRHVV